MKRILLVLVLDNFDMRGCVIKVDNKINEKISCLVELMCKLILNIPALEGRARLIAPRLFHLLLITIWQSSQTVMLQLSMLSCLRSYIKMLDRHILRTQYRWIGNLPKYNFLVVPIEHVFKHISVINVSSLTHNFNLRNKQTIQCGTLREILRATL